MTRRHDPRGSTWRKWDLHLHTPASFDYGHKGLTPEQIIAALRSADVEVAAITDHHTIDPGLIAELQELGAGNVTVMPGIELRSELGGSEYVHYIGIFREDQDVAELWNALRVKLEISPTTISKRNGDEGFYVPIETGCRVIRELGGVVTVHAGRKSNSIEQLANADAVKRAVKKELAQSCFDVLEVGRPTDCDAYKRIVFPHIGKKLPMLVCSDNHNAKEYATRCPLWVKADPTFLGLLQVINEPEHRVYLGDDPPARKRVAENATKYMACIEFTRTEYARAQDKWFEGAHPLNPGLVAVIGNKGSGKSAMADVLGLLGDSRNMGDCSFLTKDRFLQPKGGLGAMFSAALSWSSGVGPSRRLDATVDPAAPESVKYIPQKYLEAICTELKQSADTRFDQELKEVIFSHVGEAERLGRTCLDDLIDYLSKETNDRVKQIAGALSVLNHTIAEAESRSTPEHRRSVEAMLAQREAELAAHEATKPAAVAPPTQDPGAQATMKGLTDEVADLQSAVAEAERRLSISRQEERTAVARIAAADKLLARIANFERTYSTFLADAHEEAQALELRDLRDIVSLRIDTGPVHAARAAAAQLREGATAALDPDMEGSIAADLVTTSALLETKKAELDEPNRRYQTYVADLGKWDTRRQALLVSPVS